MNESVQSGGKERPILFSGPMIRALLAGTKTQTRRIVKPAPEADQELRTITGSSGFVYVMDCTPMRPFPEARRIRWDCPYGQPGDKLWVRETWGCFDAWQGFHYAADHEGFGIGPDDDPDHIPEHAVRWKPSIHMPRAASRLLLEVTEVRVERLQDISEADILAEGVTVDRVAKWCNTPWSSMPTLHHAWRVLWESINGPGSWDANPWVWCVSFSSPALGLGAKLV
jgi:hypothetical protein